MFGVGIEIVKVLSLPITKRLFIFTVVLSTVKMVELLFKFTVSLTLLAELYPKKVLLLPTRLRETDWTPKRLTPDPDSATFSVRGKARDVAFGVATKVLSVFGSV